MVTRGTAIGGDKIITVADPEKEYSDWWTGRIGRCIHHIFGGVRTGKTYGVKTFSAR